MNATAIARAESVLLERAQRRLAAERRDRAARAGRPSSLAEHAAELVSRELAVLPAARRKTLLESLLRRMVGYGPLDRLMADPEVTEIMVLGPDRIYAERHGRLGAAPIAFASERELAEIVERLLAQGARRVDELSPIADAILPDGSRVNVVIPPLAIDGPQISIRRFGSLRATLAELADRGTLDPAAHELLTKAATQATSVLISGGTSSGKTTLVAAIGNEIPAGLRLVTIEDSAEIPIDRRHLVRLQARPAGVGGGGEITLRDLIRNALRMRPDRMIVGEVRGAEALDLLGALNTGHRGVMSTIHANSAADAVERVRDLALLAGGGLPAEAVELQARRAIDLIVHLERVGSRRLLTQIARPLPGADEGIELLYERGR